MALADIGRLIEGVRRVDRLVDIEQRLLALENREELLVERMASRASKAATAVVNANLVDMARRLRAIEERSRLGGKQIE